MGAPGNKKTICLPRHINADAPSGVIDQIRKKHSIGEERQEEREEEGSQDSLMPLDLSLFLPISGGQGLNLSRGITVPVISCERNLSVGSIPA